MAGGTRQPAPRRRYHFHFPGVLYVAITLLLAVGAINSQNNLLFGALGLAIGGMLVSGLISGSGLMGISLERAPHEHGTVGAPLKLRHRVVNRNRLVPAFAVHVEEEAGRHTSWRAFFEAVHSFIAHVPAGASVVGEAEVIPERRGIASFERVKVWSKFPFGLTRKSLTFTVPCTVVIQPPVLALRRGVIQRITARAQHGSGGERTLGHGEEFFGLREYVTGDSPRLIAWKRSARAGNLIIRQHASPAPMRLWVVLRFGAGLQGAPATAAVDERAIALAAAIIRESAAAGIAVGLAVPLARIVHPPRTGRWHVDQLLGDLAVLDLQGPRAEGREERLPETVGRTGACAVVHAGGMDESFGPRAARHMDASRVEHYLEPGPELDRILRLFDRGAAREATRKRRRTAKAGSKRPRARDKQMEVA